jgi:hypothetical protein
MSNVELRSVWMTRMAEFKASGQSVTDWCAEQGLKPSQLWYHLRKEKGPAETTQWLPLDIGENTESSVTVRVGQVGVEVRPGFDPKLLLSVVITLVGLC